MDFILILWTTQFDATNTAKHCLPSALKNFITSDFQQHHFYQVHQNHNEDCPMYRCVLCQSWRSTPNVGLIEVHMQNPQFAFADVSQGILLQKWAVTLGAVHKNSLETQTKTYHLQCVVIHIELWKLPGIRVTFLFFLFNGKHCFTRLALLLLLHGSLLLLFLLLSLHL